MLWTAEAIENLKRLALEGRSASFIAAALGAASRNAVIGKANRIGIKLNGGGRAYAPSGTPAGAYRAPLAAIPHPTPVPSKRNSAVAPSYEPKRKAAWILAEAEVGEMRRVRFEDIRRFACRWPLGDPRSGDFAYCGLKPAEGHSYCAAHCRMAYRPPKAGARPSPHERRWSRALANPWRLP
jgi:GcrA cell cycle regulator